MTEIQLWNWSQERIEDHSFLLTSHLWNVDPLWRNQIMLLTLGVTQTCMKAWMQLMRSVKNKELGTGPSSECPISKMKIRFEGKISSGHTCRYNTYNILGPGYFGRKGLVEEFRTTKGTTVVWYGGIWEAVWSEKLNRPALLSIPALQTSDLLTRPRAGAPHEPVG